MEDDDRRYGDIIPPRRVRRAGQEYDTNRALMEAARAIPEGWGLSNVIEALRNRSAARLAAARRHKVEEWERFLAALNRLGYQMKEYERTRRSLENFHETLDAEEAHDEWVLRLARQREIEEAETALSESRRRRVEADRALDRARGVEQPNVSKEQPRKPSPEERIREGIIRRKELNDACNAYIEEILEAARASDTENSPDVQREIENVKRDFAKEIARTYEKG